MTLGPFESAAIFGLRLPYTSGASVLKALRGAAVLPEHDRQLVKL